MKKFLCFIFISLMTLGIVACSDSQTTGGGEVPKDTIDTTLFKDLKEIRFSSYESGTEVSTVHNLKQVAPYDDTYKIAKYVYDVDFRKKFFMGGHMNPCGYVLTAQMAASYIDYIIRHNIKDFEQVGFIGTGLQYVEK